MPGLENTETVATIDRHLAITAKAPETAPQASQDALLQVLSGAQPLETRLKIVRGLLGKVDVSLNSLLEEHLESIRAEAEADGREELAEEAEELLKSLQVADN